MPKQKFRVSITYEIETTESAVESTSEAVKDLVEDQTRHLGFGGNQVWWTNSSSMTVKVKKLRW